MSYVVDILVIFLLIILNGVFAMSELAVVSARKVRLKTLAEEGQRGAEIALDLAENPGRFLSTVQIGITLVGILAGTFSGATLAKALGSYLNRFPLIAPTGEPLAIGLVVLSVTYLSLIVGELVPKQLALRNAERIAAAIARPMALLAKTGIPIVYFLELSTAAVLRLLGQHRVPEQTVTEEEGKEVIAEGVTSGVLKPVEQEMISGVMRLADWRVQAIMTPRREIVWIDLEDSAEDIRHKLRETNYSRFPVALGGLDEFLGIVQTKDLLNRVLDGKPLDIKGALCQPLVVHNHMLALRVLEMIKQSPIHMAIVVDEHGVLEGLVTATDILKAIVGSLAEPGASAEPEIEQREDGSWLMDGNLPVEIVEDLLGLKEIPEERDFHTLAGFMLSRFEWIPAAGDHFEWEGFRFEVVDMDGHRIDKVLVAISSTS
jgi:magnesium and cobalt exporter, CNNM family